MFKNFHGTVVCLDFKHKLEVLLFVMLDSFNTL